MLVEKSTDDDVRKAELEFIYDVNYYCHFILTGKFPLYARLVEFWKTCRNRNNPSQNKENDHHFEILL